MKNKKSTQLVLALVVIAIWGTVAYKFLNYSGGLNDSPSFTILDKRNSNDSTVSPSASSYELALDYPDPFTGKRTVALPNTNQVSTVTFREEVSQEEMESVAAASLSIEYRGYLLHQQQIASVRIYVNNKPYTAKLNEVVESIMIVGMTRDSVILQMPAGERQVVYRKK